MQGPETVWTSQTKSKDRSWHAKLLLDVQRARSVALEGAGVAPAQMRVTQTDAMCARLASASRVGDWQDYLELVSGLTVVFWTEPIAQELLALAAGCADARQFEKVVGERWSAIEGQGSSQSDLGSGLITST